MSQFCISCSAGVDICGGICYNLFYLSLCAHARKAKRAVVAERKSVLESERFSRTARLLGQAAMERLRGATVMVVGLGGVGGYAFESLLRLGVGRLIAVDGDTVALSNCNRQILADDTTVGQQKTEVAAARAARVSPATVVVPVNLFLTRENVGELFGGERIDAVLDCIDTVSAKIALAVEADARGIPLLSCMSTGNKLDPTRLRVGRLDQTHTCPLCRVMRRELGARGLGKLPVVWSDETPLTPTDTPTERGRHIPASAPFVPPVAGILMARWAMEQILKTNEESV